MQSNGRNVSVEALNARRLQAVKLRLAGKSIAETALDTGLSQPTVIRALKAYEAGGWSAVPVGRRGRGSGKPSPVENDVRHENIKQFNAAPVAITTPLADAPGRAMSNAKLSTLTHLQRLEAEALHIMREVAAEAINPVMLYSIGKDSSVMLHLARKAFFPARPPFPLMHIDTTWKFRAMYAFRDRAAAEAGMQLIVHTNPDGLAAGINPFVHGSAIHTDIMKTQALKQALDTHGFDAAFGGARRRPASRCTCTPIPRDWPRASGRSRTAPRCTPTS